ncbi:hypothetical protein JCM8097_007808 [Rhodosporidiobolus ruineniae]
MPRKKSLPAPEMEEDGRDGIEGHELQKSVVARLARAALPEDVKMQSTVPSGLVKGSTVFISYLAALSHDTATERNHKTINATHVLDAVKQLGWDDGDELHRVLKKELAAFRAENEAKKAGRELPSKSWQGAPPKKASKPRKPKAAPSAAASTSTPAPAAAAPADASAPPADLPVTAATEEDPNAGATLLTDDRPNADEAAELGLEEEEGYDSEDVFPEPSQDEDNAGLEEYVSDAQAEDEEMEEAGSEGVDDVDDAAPAERMEDAEYRD